MPERVVRGGTAGEPPRDSIHLKLASAQRRVERNDADLGVPAFAFAVLGETAVARPDASRLFPETYHALEEIPDEPAVRGAT